MVNHQSVKIPFMNIIEISGEMQEDRPRFHGMGREEHMDKIMDFGKVRFNGTFRSYQQKVLDNIQTHLDDSKIHVVAAPGSGKTILGLELIRRLNVPALILSPTVTIREQWGTRFGGQFLTEGETADAYLSFRLKSPKLLTSVTYQALHSAWTRQNPVDAQDDAIEDEYAESYEGFDLVATMKRMGVRTICLDEAHHLRSEWQKALEGFIHAIEHDVTVISLTATPPYDSTPAEWHKYVSLCGEIDEEIFVPELVYQQTLCPHQDYIHFNYPSDSELEIIHGYRKRVAETVGGIVHGEDFAQLIKTSDVFIRHQDHVEAILDHADGFTSLLTLAQYGELPVPRQLVRLLETRKLPRFSMEHAQRALNLLVEQPGLFAPGIPERIQKTLERAHLIKRGKVCLVSDDRLRKTLVSSAGKLESIAAIATEESARMGEGLRMLVLTDHIKKNLLGVVGTDQGLECMGTVPVFEAIRRAVGDKANAAVLSGTLVLWPQHVWEPLREIARGMGIAVSSKPLIRAPFLEVTFGGSNKHKVAVITEAFRQGLCHILVGTKSLLGEGWDSPCINTLVLASFVGSFMLSNQMRGRAIRTDRDQPGKTANIWHLATLEPEAVLAEQAAGRLHASLFDNNQTLVSEDYDTLVRRFNCFMGPAYHDTLITNGIERLDIIRPPYARNNIESINARMLALAADREGMAERWQQGLEGFDGHEIIDIDKVPAIRPPSKFLYVNLLYASILAALLLGQLRFSIPIFDMASGTAASFVVFASFVVLMLLFFVLTHVAYNRILLYLSPARLIERLGRALLETLRDMGKIKSSGAEAIVKSDEGGTFIECYLKSASAYEKNLFADAVAELLSPIDNPRYLLISSESKWFWKQANYARSYACPSVIASRKEDAALFARKLRERHIPYVLHYTRHEAGRKILLKCRRRSYINRNHRYLERRRLLTGSRH